MLKSSLAQQSILLQEILLIFGHSVRFLEVGRAENFAASHSYKNCEVFSLSVKAIIMNCHQFHVITAARYVELFFFLAFFFLHVRMRKSMRKTLRGVGEGSGGRENDNDNKFRHKQGE